MTSCRSKSAKAGEIKPVTAWAWIYKDGQGQWHLAENDEWSQIRRRCSRIFAKPVRVTISVARPKRRKKKSR